MNRKLLIAMIGIFLCVSGFYSCGPTEEELLQRKALVQQTYLKRLAKYKQEHRNRCRREILKEAKIIADSTLLANARNVKVVDSIPRPPKPIKPGLPTPKSLDDSLEIEPFLTEPTLDSIN